MPRYNISRQKSDLDVKKITKKANSLSAFISSQNFMNQIMKKALSHELVDFQIHLICW